jgi:hypothetical protein
MMAILEGDYYSLDAFGVQYMFRQDGQVRTLMTRARALVGTADSLKYPSLDAELRTLIVRCLAMKRVDRPTLGDLLAQTLQGLQKPASAYADDGLEDTETDEYIKELVRRMLHDAPFDETTL